MSNDIPNTLLAANSASETGRPQIFEPSLKHFMRAFRLGDSVSPTMHERLEWESARAEVRAHLLEIVATSRWRNHLILRGSTLMQLWFGERARDPKDIDWVFQPADVKLGDPLCEECFAELTELVKENPATRNTEILTARIASDDIWTYERAAGRRLVFPFQSEAGQREVQMDIVWNEPMPEPPVLTPFPMKSGTEIALWAATPELSLAWKLLWLVTDSYAQGKDLYDAVLLAEHTHLSFELFMRVLNSDKWLREHNEASPHLVKQIEVDWHNFQLEYPWIEGDEKDWHKRLLQAMAPTFRDA